jgi:flagellar FliL protein
MATPPVIEAKITADPVKLPVIPLLIAVALGVVTSVSILGGLMYYLLHSGKVPIHAVAAPTIEASSLQKTHSVALEPLLVNLADSSGGSYLRVALTLEIFDGSRAKEEKSAEAKGAEKDTSAAVRDTVLSVLGRQSSGALLAINGKEQLKKELRAAIAEHNPDIKLKDVFFTEFLVQR